VKKDSSSPHEDQSGNEFIKGKSLHEIVARPLCSKVSYDIVRQVLSWKGNKGPVTYRHRRMFPNCCIVPCWYLFPRKDREWQHIRELICQSADLSVNLP
jgi:hypothetical protein